MVQLFLIQHSNRFFNITCCFCYYLEKRWWEQGLLENKGLKTLVLTYWILYDLYWFYGVPCSDFNFIRFYRVFFFLFFFGQGHFCNFQTCWMAVGLTHRSSFCQILVLGLSCGFWSKNHMQVETMLAIMCVFTDVCKTTIVHIYGVYVNVRWCRVFIFLCHLWSTYDIRICVQT